MSETPIVAAFDLDGTLTVRDAVVPFLVSSGGKARFLRCCASNALALLRCVVLKDRDKAKEIATRSMLQGVHRTHLEKCAESLSNRIAAGWLRSDVLDRLRWHQEMGHYTVIVSASFGMYVSPLAELLQIDHVIATELEFDAEDRCTGELLGGNCRGEEKASRLRHVLSELGNDCELTWAYGDSSGDIPMLEMAKHGIHVTNKELAKVGE